MTSPGASNISSETTQAQGGKREMLAYPKLPVVIGFTQREIDWLNNYAGNHEMSLEAAVRHAVRMLSTIEGTPGASAVLLAMVQAHIGPKYQPMPPLPEAP